MDKQLREIGFSPASALVIMEIVQDYYNLDLVHDYLRALGRLPRCYGNSLLEVK